MKPEDLANLSKFLVSNTLEIYSFEMISFFSYVLVVMKLINSYI